MFRMSDNMSDIIMLYHILYYIIMWSPMFRMSDTVIRLIERRSVGDKYILVSLHINNLFFIFVVICHQYR